MERAPGITGIAAANGAMTDGAMTAGDAPIPVAAGATDTKATRAVMRERDTAGPMRVAVMLEVGFMAETASMAAMVAVVSMVAAVFTAAVTDNP